MLRPEIVSGESRESHNNGKVSETEIKSKIFMVAQQLFVEKGYHRTSIPDIVKEAGVSTGAIYHHYSSKEDLAREIHRVTVGQFLKKYAEEVASRETTYEKIRAYTALLFRWVEEDPVMVRYLLYGRPKEILDKCLSVCSEEGLRATMEIVHNGISRGEVRPMSPTLAAASISGILMRMLELRIDGLIEHSLIEYIEAAANNIWLSVKA